ncbi:MAG: LysM peptidoglycan-binding domain-containing protein [Acidimicrobiales bacterium]
MAIAVVVFAAVPVVLSLVAGWPVPARWDRSALWPSKGLTDGLAVVAWVAWGRCAWPVLQAVARRARRRDGLPVAGAPLADRLAVTIVSALLVLVSMATPSPGAAALGVLAPAVTATMGPAGASASPPADAGPPTPIAAEATAAAEAGRYTVRPGDTLWTIAERLYGSGAGWSAIAACNVDRPMGGGQRFVDPALIYPGWVLTLPDPPPAPAGQPPTPPTTTPTPPPTTTTTVPGAVETAVSGGRRADVGRRHPVGPPVPLPELAALGFGSLLAAALARRVRTGHRLPPSPAVAAGPGSAPEPAAETAALLAPFDRTPALRWFEAANRLLGELHETGAGTPAPGVRLVRVGADGVELWLSEPGDRAPAPWEVVDRRRWRLPAGTEPGSLPPASAGRAPRFPLTVPVGENEDGSWLVPLLPGSRLPVLGPESDRLVRAMAAGADSWEWSAQVVVTDDPTVAARAVSGDGGGADGPPAVLFVGDPERLGRSLADRCAVITTLPVAATDLTITVDRQATSVHPLGLTLRPDLLGPTRAAALGDLLGDCRLAGASTPDSGVALRRAPTNGDATPTSIVPAPGPREVRLLTSVPRIDGLAVPLSPKVARRAIELVAYLAMHRPDPVAGDRLRTRVLGSAETDAARKTLLNVVGAARHALGVDDAGDPYLPRAGKTGLYRLSPLVTADAARAAVLVTAGLESADPVEAMALLRAALDLVESEPLVDVQNGYGWWVDEGHEGRIGALLVDGACELARLAIADGRPALGRWGVDKARLVNRYSEALTRAAMRVAAESGDGDRLHREWVECRRRVDELDPGSLPSVQTERLYADLRRSVPALASDADP